MVPDIYEKLAHEHRQTLLREAEYQRLLVVRQHASPPSLQRLTARLGGYLIAVGTRLQRPSAVRSAVE